MNPQPRSGLSIDAPDFDYGRVNVVRHNHLFLYFCFEFFKACSMIFLSEGQAFEHSECNGFRK
jgi:hypothetical protein